MDYEGNKQSRGSQARALSVEALIFLGLLVLYSYFIQPPGANALSRYDLVLAAAEQGTMRIDAYQANTEDKGFFAGHYYSDKPLGVALVSLPLYLGMRGLLGNLHLWPLNDQYVVYLLNLFVAAGPTALLAVLIDRAVGRLARPGPPAVLAAVAYGVGTLALPFATLYFGHQTSAFFGFVAFYALLGAGQSRHAAARSLLAGALAGAAVITEYPLVIVAGALAVYALLRLRRPRYLALYLLGGLPFAVLLGLYNYANFGNALSLSYEHVFLSKFADMHRGLFGLTAPNGWALLDLLFGGRGLLTNTPILALAPLGAWALWQGRRWRVEAGLFAAIVGLFLIYNSAYFLPFGGWTPGPRFLVPMLPFAVVALGVAVARWRSVATLAVPLTVVSATTMFVATATVPLVGDSPPLPFFQRWLPQLADGQMALNLGTLRFGLQGALSLVPLAVLLALVALAGAIGRVHILRQGRPRLAYTLSLASILALLWPGALPGLAVGAATELAPGEPSVVVQSVNLLPPSSDGQERVEVVVRSLSGFAPNMGLLVRVADAGSGQSEEQLMWPVSLPADKPARFVWSWHGTLPRGSPRFVDVQVMHWSENYALAAVRVTFYLSRVQQHAGGMISGIPLAQ